MKKIITNKKNFYRLAVLIYLIVYGLLSFRTLEVFPLVHSDESWLAGLSRNMAESGDFSVTEPFFDAWMRYPHAIKILFHAIQILIFSLADYAIGPVRLLSLISGCIVLYLFFLTVEKLLKNTGTAFLFMLIFSFDIQFIYASHFARQEINLLLFFVACLYILFHGETPYTTKQALLLGILTGIGITLHPNSFLIACMVGCIFLAYMIHTHCWNFKPLVVYTSVCGICAAVIVAISNSFRSNFLTNYFSYGSDTFGIDAAAGDRFTGLIGFFKRLFLREGGTYYVADIRLQLLLFTAVALILTLFYFVMRKEEHSFCQNILQLLFGGVGIVAGIFVEQEEEELSVAWLHSDSNKIEDLLYLFQDAICIAMKKYSGDVLITFTCYSDTLSKIIQKMFKTKIESNAIRRWSMSGSEFRLAKSTVSAWERGEN